MTTHPLGLMSSSRRLQSAARSSVGTVRSSNEDRFLERGDIGLWAVADGMGGHQRGDFASAVIVDALADLPACDSGYALLTAVRERLDQANLRLIDEAAAMGPSSMIGSTVVVLIAFEDHFACVWAGDSRLYRLRQGGLSQVSRDHSVVQEMIDRGELGPDDARTHSGGKAITRAIGAAEHLELAVTNGRLSPGDVFLLCTDGLTDAVPEPEIAALMRKGSVSQVGDQLMSRALERGASDNVTLIVVAVA